MGLFLTKFFSGVDVGGDMMCCVPTTLLLTNAFPGVGARDEAMGRQPPIGVENLLFSNEICAIFGQTCIEISANLLQSPSLDVVSPSRNSGLCLKELIQLITN